MDFNTKELISKVTEAVINEYEISIPIVNIDSIVSKIGGHIEEDDSLSGYSDGFICKENDSFKIVVSPYQAETRRNFTIAHELGHLFIHMGYNIDEELWSKQNEKTYYRNGSSIEESHANEFAAAFLMPKQEYKRVMDENTSGNIVDIKSIAQHFNVSINAASNRGKFLGYLQW